MHFAFLAMHIEISSDMPQIMYFGSSHTYLTVEQANLTVERGFSHCKQCREVERSAFAPGPPEFAYANIGSLYTIAISLRNSELQRNLEFQA